MKRIPLEKIKRIAFCTVLVLMVLGIWNMRHQLVDLLMKADWRYVAAAAVVAFIYLPLNASVWGLVLRSLGTDVSRVRAGSLWIRCEAMRYLPGGIWGYASRVVEACRLGVSKGISAVSLSVELVITALSWGIVAVAGTDLWNRIRTIRENPAGQFARMDGSGCSRGNDRPLPCLVEIRPAAPHFCS
ncbi:MAG: hypothetical protein R3F19_34090 [Verrucomicrobiales bacterium]